METAQQKPLEIVGKINLSHNFSPKNNLFKTTIDQYWGPTLQDTDYQWHIEEIDVYNYKYKRIVVVSGHCQ